jgi:hypothetical protein
VLTAAGRRTRVIVTVATFGLLLAGTVAGGDDAFPFGPFRMYATRDAPDGVVVSTRVEAVDARGRVVPVPDTATGMRRAEIEGQVGGFRQDPALLGALSRAHARLHPDEPAYVVVRVVEREYRLRNSRPTGDQTDRVVAQWAR